MVSSSNQNEHRGRCADQGTPGTPPPQPRTTHGSLPTSGSYQPVVRHQNAFPPHLSLQPAVHQSSHEDDPCTHLRWAQEGVWRHGGLRGHPGPQRAYEPRAPDGGVQRQLTPHPSCHRRQGCLRAPGTGEATSPMDTRKH